MLTNTHKEERPWGSFEQFTLNEASTVKILHVSSGARFSLQKHAQRSEYWRVIAGSGVVQLDDATRELTIGDTVDIPAGTLHRLTGGPEGISVLEISLGAFDESDIVRTEDDYGRIPATP